MLTFAIIAEGFTDQIVLERILFGFFGNRQVVVNHVQPPPPEDDGAPVPPGGWTLVFDVLEQGEHEQALMRNDYIVVQIDTDVAHDYGIAYQDGASVEDVVDRVSQRLVQAIGADSYAANRERILFAITVDSIECWLLPLHYEDNRAGKITGCFEAVDRALQKKRFSLKRGRDGKDPRAYREASRDFTKRKRLLEVHDRNPSLALFVRRLEAVASPPDAPSSPEPG